MGWEKSSNTRYLEVYGLDFRRSNGKFVTASVNLSKYFLRSGERSDGTLAVRHEELLHDFR